MSYTIQKTDSQITIVIEEELTIAQVKGFRDDLLAAASDQVTVVIDATGAKRIDMSVVQVLYAMHRTTGGITVRNPSASMKEYLGRAGVAMDCWPTRSSRGDAETTMSMNGANNG